MTGGGDECVGVTGGGDECVGVTGEVCVIVGAEVPVELEPVVTGLEWVATGLAT